jgi:uracil-DNA glycosylase family 4
MSELTDLYRLIGTCVKCDLCRGRTLAVPGEGPENAEIMLVGEGPGFNEDKQGRPFVGQAGQFLEQLLGQAGFKRSDVYITNVVKCRPPGNRDPLPEEVETCHVYLQQQIDLINPKVIVTLGRISMSSLLTTEPISRVHGKERLVSGRYIYPMYHPAAALHQPSFRRYLIEDIKRLPEVLQKARDLQPTPAPAARPDEPAPQQGKLF